MEKEYIFCVFIIVLGIFLFALLIQLRQALKELSSLRGSHNTAEDRSLQLLRDLPPSPICRLEYSEFCSSPDRAASELRSYVVQSVKRLLRADVINIGLQVIQGSSGGTRFICQFSPEASRLYGAGSLELVRESSSGRVLAQLRDHNGRFVEHAEVVGQVGACARQAWSILVSAAHIISGIDISKRLGRVEKKLSELIVGRRIDQMAELEEIYAYARSVLSRRPDSHTIATLSELRFRLFGLRCRWREEIVHLISSMEIPDKPWWHVTSWPFVRERIEKKAMSALPRIVECLENSQRALMIDACIAFSSGTVEDLRVQVLPGEAKQWAKAFTASSAVYSRIRNPEIRSLFDSLRAALEGFRSSLLGFSDVSSSKSSR